MGGLLIYAHPHDDDVSFTDIEMELLEMECGKRTLLLDGYPFYKKSTNTRGEERWSCNKNNCKCFVQLTKELSIVRGNFIHNHQNTIHYKRTGSGKYVKVF